MTEKTIDQHTLDQFTGTESWFRHWWVPQITYTEGAKYVFDTYGAHWFLDQIVFTQLDEKELRKEEFQVWKLDVTEDRVGMITVEDGNKHVVHTAEIPYTDFPKPGITLWFVDQVILLPSEY
jgi:hypothetical protein